ncbi:MAG: DUF1772 domain-containing protein [Actinoplanes sp.]
MLNQSLGVLALVGSGLVAGVLFAVALSVLPGLFAMPPGRYVYAQRLIGRNWDPTMPIVVLTSVALDIGLAVATGGSQRRLFALCAVLLVGVSVVSHFCNVPINRRVKSLDPDRMPADWQDPRPVWRRWHLLRTVLAVLALLGNAIALT